MKSKLTDAFCLLVASILFAILLFSCVKEDSSYYVATETVQEDGSHYMWVE